MKVKKIVFINESLEEAFNSMSDIDPTKKALIRAIKNIKEDPYVGRNVKKRLIPKTLIQKYGINNLWIYNLPSSWRLIYTLTPKDEIEIIAVILDWMSHKDYERLFKF